MKCRLCNATGTPFFKGRFGEYFDCSGCRAIFLSPDDHLSSNDERSRYLTHNNDVEDIGYREFVAPIVDAISNDFSPGQRGLDYGCGTGPVISHLLKQKGYSMTLYDPFFHNDQSVFRDQYDFIVCCEVMEHFRHPDREFAKLRQMLKPGGQLVCMTQIFEAEASFEDWGYKNDSTHIFFYREETIRYIEKAFGFSGVSITDRLIVLET